MFLLVMVEVMLVLGPTNFPPKNMIFAETGIMWGLVHIIIGANTHPWHNNSVMII